MCGECRVIMSSKAPARQRGSRPPPAAQRVSSFPRNPGIRDFPEAPYWTPPRAVAATTYCKRSGCTARLSRSHYRGHSEVTTARAHAQPARTHAAWPAPPTPRRGREAWAPPRSVRPRPGPRLRLLGTSGSRRNPLRAPGRFKDRAGPGAAAPGAVAAGTGRRRGPRAEVGKLRASRGELAELCARRGDGGLGQSPVQGAAGRVPGLDVPDQAGDPPANPFKERICKVFSTSPTRDSLSFEDFLDLLSVFSDTATPDIKSHYAFRIFDFDDDGTLNREDLSRLVNRLTGEGEDTRLSVSEMKQLIDNILEESDIDRDGTINLSEFQHVISRSPDFASSFKIVL
ncbi:calcium and integrin-binding protein 1 isoform X1 [Microcebus murinus]|uniref:calcium and integrin-binding protein 1 isoform X1 n=1 Tax=Microcebus murinus TaxID=30608 RepID=UPI003F6C032F